MTKANDTHGATGESWYGFDLDGTLAVYDTWQGIGHIGEPIKPMVDLIKKFHAEGKIVKILTARVAPRENEERVERLRCDAPDYVKNGDYSGLAPDAKEWVVNMYLALDTWDAREFIVDWCLKNLGFLPEITHQKDHLMLELYDDRVKQVIPNKGELVEDIARIQSREIQKCERIFNSYERESLRLSRKLDCKFNGFFSGMMLGSLIASVAFAVVTIVLRPKTPQTEALNHLRINGIVFSGSHEDIEWAVSRFAPDMPAAPTQSSGQCQTDTATVKDNPDPHLREFQELEERFLYKHGGGEAGIALSDIPPVPFPDHDGSTCVKQHGQLDA